MLYADDDLKAPMHWSQAITSDGWKSFQFYLVKILSFLVARITWEGETVGNFQSIVDHQSQ